MKCARGDKQYVICFHGPMLSGHCCTFNQRQQVALYTFATDIRSARIGAGADFINLIKKHDSALFYSRQGGFGDDFIVEQFICLFSEQDIITRRYGHLFAAGPAAHGFAEDISEIHHSHLTAWLTGKIQCRQRVGGISNLKLYDRVI